MRKRFDVQRRRQHRAVCSECELALRKSGGLSEWKLECIKCGKFYGYVKSEKDLEFYRRAVMDNGSFKMSTVRWLVTDYTNKSDNFRRRKEPIYDCRTDSLPCEQCGMPYLGTACPGCGHTREVRKVRVLKRRRRR